MTDSAWITSHLVVGGNAGTVSGIREHVNSVEAAIRALNRGTTAVLPAGAFDLAKEVLVAAGRDEAGAAWQVDSARGLVQPCRCQACQEDPFSGVGCASLPARE